MSNNQEQKHENVNLLLTYLIQTNAFLNGNGFFSLVSMLRNENQQWQCMSFAITLMAGKFSPVEFYWGNKKMESRTMASV